MAPQQHESIRAATLSSRGSRLSATQHGYPAGTMSLTRATQLSPSPFSATTSTTHLIYPLGLCMRPRRTRGHSPPHAHNRSTIDFGAYVSLLLTSAINYLCSWVHCQTPNVTIKFEILMFRKMVLSTVLRTASSMRKSNPINKYPHKDLCSKS